MVEVRIGVPRRRERNINNKQKRGEERTPSGEKEKNGRRGVREEQRKEIGLGKE